MCVSPENSLLCHRPVDVHVYVHTVLRQHLIVADLTALESEVRHNRSGIEKEKRPNIRQCKLIVLPNCLQKPFVQDEVSGGKVERAVLTQLSVPVLTSWPVGRVQVEGLGQLTIWKEAG